MSYSDSSSDTDLDSSDVESPIDSQFSSFDNDVYSSPSPVESKHAVSPYYDAQPSSPIDTEDDFDQTLELSSMITKFIDHHYSITGRFDQQKISDLAPMPSYPSAFEQLGIAATMINHFEDHPNDIKELDLRNDHKAWKDGVPWSQYENACLVEEMSLHMRTRGDSKIGGATLMTKMSHILNERYGIGRSPMGVKNQWYRTLRARSGIDERGCFRTARNAGRFMGPLAVSQGGGRAKTRGSSGRSHKRKSGAKRKH